MNHRFIPQTKLLASLLLLAFSILPPHPGRASEGPDVPNNAKTTLFHPRLANILKNNPLIDASGNPVQVDRLLSKKYIFVYFSGYYCHPCRVLTPHLIAFYREEIKNGDFEFLFCDDFDVKKEAMDKYMREAMMPWPCLLYNDPAVPGLQALVGKHPGGVPYLYLLDQNDELIAIPTNAGTDHQSWFSINKWLSLHDRPPIHWNFMENYQREFPD
ncbi:MAG: thioredoxin-like domain-containing protein [Terrimicrobiaceae bacterium]